MIRLFRLFVLAGAFCTAPAFAADPLAALQWDRRPLLLFAKSRSDAGLDKQLELLRERRPDLRERDMLVLVTQGRQDTIAAIGYTALPRGTARALRARFAPAAKGLTVVLVGKDGTEKARWNRVVEPDTLFARIDAMPMRRSQTDRPEQ